MSVEEVGKKTLNLDEINNLIVFSFMLPLDINRIKSYKRKTMRGCCSICNHGSLDSILDSINCGSYSHFMTYSDDDGIIHLILNVRRDKTSFHVDLVHCSSLENLENIARKMMKEFNTRFINDTALVMTTNFPDCIEKYLKYDYLIRSFSTNTKKRAVLMFTDANENVVYSYLDCERLSSHLNSTNVIVMKIRIVDITKEAVDQILHNLRSMGVEKIMIYYTGCGENTGGNFPTVLLKNDTQLNYNELDTIITSKSFDLVIVGYDCSNVQKVLPIARSNAHIECRYIDELIFGGTGKITFCAASVGYDAYADSLDGGWYTKEWIDRALSGNFEDFVSVIGSIDKIVKTRDGVDYKMVPCFIYE